MNYIKQILLFDHPSHYRISTDAEKTLLSSWYRHEIYANRHFELARDQTYVLTAAIHGAIGVIESCPILGLIVAKTEKWVATHLLPHILFNAAKSNDLEALTQAIKNKATLTPSSYAHHLTPLHIAAQNGHVDAARYLIQNEADVNLPTLNDKKTPLDLAIASGHAEMVELLMQNGARLSSLKDSCSLRMAVTPLLSSERLVNQEERFKIVALLAQESDPKVRQDTLMLVATSIRHSNAIRLVDILKKSGAETTPLFHEILRTQGIEL